MPVPPEKLTEDEARKVLGRLHNACVEIDGCMIARYPDGFYKLETEPGWFRLGEVLDYLLKTEVIRP